MKIFYNISAIFHTLIITSFLLSVSGCGYKAPPYYEKEAPEADENIEFHNEKKKFDNNESCE